MKFAAGSQQTRTLLSLHVAILLRRALAVQPLLYHDVADYNIVQET